MKIKRNILLNPGPATTTDTVKMAQVVPDICPREKEFGDILRGVAADLVKIVHGDPQKYTAVLSCGSGTINMDMCLNSLLPEGKKILVINNGAYSTRAVEICRAYNLPFVESRWDFDQRPNLEEIERILQSNPDIYLVYATHNETGTGLLNPIREIGAIVHRYNGIFVVDTTSTYAMLPIDMEKDNLDFCMASAQKGLMAMTGLSFIVGKTSLIEQSKDFPIRSYYCNIYLQYKYFRDTGEMRFTPPVQTVYATRQAIDEYFAEGENTKHQRHLAVHGAITRGIEALGFRNLIKKEWQAGLVVTVPYPSDPNWDFMKIHDYCYERGFTIYPGKILGKSTFRLCSLGAIDVPDIEAFFEVFSHALKFFKVSVPVRYE